LKFVIYWEMVLIKIAVAVKGKFIPVQAVEALRVARG
jgi:hypothetical protein